MSNWLDDSADFAVGSRKDAFAVHVLDSAQSSPQNMLSTAHRRYAEAAGWKPKANSMLVVRAENGAPRCALYAADFRLAFPLGALPARLAGVAGDRAIKCVLEGIKDTKLREVAAQSWLVGMPDHPRGKEKDKDDPVPSGLIAPQGIDAGRVKTVARSVRLARRLINAPANALGPAGLEEAAREAASDCGAKVECIVGEALVEQGWPLVHAVGRAAAQAPRVVDMVWGNPRSPKVTLVGKGVTFDTGGLDIKPSRAMRNMKKDMGGAACALALARMVMERGLSVRLRLLLPIAENAVSSASFRPGDVLRSRKGLTVEIGNTDAEGRLLLADALAAADADKPRLLFNFATLTGAARVALGPDLPAMYAPSDRLAREIETCCASERDPVWRMPLWEPYDAALKSQVADVSSTGSEALAGSITAALFLRRFVERRDSWAHFDLFAWTAKGSPGKPPGGECQVACGLFRLLERRYPPK